MKNIAVEVLENHTSGGTWELDLDTQELWWSRGTYELHALSPDCYTPTLESSIDFYEPESQARLRTIISQAQNFGDGWSTTLALRRADGNQRFVHCVGRVEERPGQSALLAGAIFDVHEQILERMARDATVEPDSDDAVRWRTAAENAGLSLLEIDFDADTIRISGVLAGLIGPDEATDIRIEASNWHALIHPDDRLSRRQRLEAHQAGALAHYACDYRLCLADGSQRVLRETGRYISDDERPRLVGTLSDISNQVAAERAIRDSRRVLEQTLLNAPIGIALIDIEGRWVSANHALCTMLGYSERQLTELHEVDITHPDDGSLGKAGAKALLAGEIGSHRFEKRYLDSGGAPIEVQIDIALLRDDEQAPLYFIVHVQDIRERKAGERALFDAKQLADVTFEAIGEGVIRVDHAGLITQINSAACALLRIDHGHAIGHAFDQVVTLLSAEQDERLPDPVAHVIATGERIRAPIFTRLCREGGDCVAIVDSASPIRDQRGRIRGAVFVFRDVSEARRMTDELDYQARHDDLTGLLNRRGFEQALATVWRAVRLGASPVHVLYLDLDYFKAINDLSGHAVGDEMLRQVAAALRSTLRSGDIMARVGGDEFAAVAHVGDDASAEILADRLIARIRRLRFTLGGQRHDAGASVGIACLGPDAEAWGTALMRADTALYIAKDAGRNRYHLYGSGTSAQPGAVPYPDITRLLQAGFDQSHFALYLQEIVDAKGQPRGFEALLRYEGAGGLVAPDLFLPTAKRLGMMSRIDCWVVEQALKLIRDARATGRWAEAWYLSVNLSPLSLAEPGFHAELVSLIERYATRSSDLAFEIIESDALYGEQYVDLIQDLRRRGIRVWLDDFASGYNSFNTLKQISVDGIKIDRSFVQDIERNPIDRAVLRSIGDISGALALDVVAEGVETIETLELLCLAGFSHFQGFHFHRPEAADLALERHAAMAVVRAH